MKIEIKNLTKTFKKEVVLNNVSMTLEEGKIYGFVGQNGSGKSVLLKIIASLYRPTSGNVFIDGIDYNHSKDFPSDIRALIENPCFLPDLSGMKNLKLLADINHKIDDKQILETLDLVNLTADKDKKYSKYSLGMKQKLGIACVLMEDPKIIILDEPFNGVENNTKEKIIKELKKMKKNKIIIITSHIKDEINLAVDELYKFESGNVSRQKLSHVKNKA